MSIHELVVKEEIFSLEKKSSSDRSRAVSFIGSPSKHPNENDKFILILDPVSEHTEFIEFKKDDVLFVEDLPSLLTNDDESIGIKRVWIREGALGLKLTPFVVAKTRSAPVFSLL